MLEIWAFPSTDFGSHFWCVRDTGASKLIFTGYSLQLFRVGLKMEQSHCPMKNKGLRRVMWFHKWEWGRHRNQAHSKEQWEFPKHPQTCPLGSLKRPWSNLLVQHLIPPPSLQTFLVVELCDREKEKEFCPRRCKSQQKHLRNCYQPARDCQFLFSLGSNWRLLFRDVYTVAGEISPVVSLMPSSPS